MSDPIADMFTRIRNAYAVNKETVSAPYSKLKMEIAKLLKKEGYIKEVVKRGKKFRKSLEITLLYKDGDASISNIKRVSKPSRRIYTPFKEIYSVRSGRGIKILSTSKGIMSDNDARKEKVGGEIIGEIW